MQVSDKYGKNQAFSWMKKEPEAGQRTISAVMEADVVVIGAGHAGTCAARAASETRGDPRGGA